MSQTPDIPGEAIDTITAFLEANRRQDEEGMRACLSRATLESGSFDGPDGNPTDYYLGEPRREGDHVVVPVRMVPPGAGEDSEESMDLPCILVPEGGAWKFDLAGTMEMVFGGEFEDAVEQVAGAMADAMEGIGEAFGGGEEDDEEEDEEEDEGRWDDAPLVPSEEEWLPLPAMTRLPITSSALSEAVGFDLPFEADLDGLLLPFGEEQRDQMVGWFEGSLFAGWPAMLAEVNERIPLANRLRAIRVERAPMPHDRLLAVDGHDLVYRIRLPESEGFYQDAEARERLSGVLAGLPESIDPGTVGHRLLPTADETPDRDLYLDVLIPRHMRRVSELLGHHVSLEGNWEDLLGSTAEMTGLYHWGTSRVMGAVALACLDGDRREAIARDLHTLEMRFVSDSDECGADFDDGVLAVAISPFRAEAGGLYEYEIARALPGAGPPDS